MAITAGLGDVSSADAATTDAATADAAPATDASQATTQLSADQAAQLLADGATAPTLPAPSAKPSDLKDGTYTATIEAVNAANQQQLSMSNGAIDHTVKIVVKDGKATLALTSTGMKNTITNDGSIVYLGAVYYYNLSDTKTPVKVVDTVKGEDGKDFTDNYSKYLERVDASAYPKTVEIPLDETTTVDNYYKLGVFVPVMESLGDATGMTGMGNQNVLLNVDWSSLKSDARPRQTPRRSRPPSPRPRRSSRAPRPTRPSRPSRTPSPPPRRSSTPSRPTRRPSTPLPTP